MDDNIIIELYWARNETAIKETNIKYGGLLYSIAYNILSNQEDSQECVNDTYFNAWNSIPPQKPNSLCAFLGRIVRNISIDLWRKNRAQKRYTGLEIMLSELYECIPDPTTIYKEYDGKVLSQIISDWLYTLSKAERTLFLHRYWFGYSLKELANDYETSPNKLAGKTYRLRQSLKENLEKEGIIL